MITLFSLLLCFSHFPRDIFDGNLILRLVDGFCFELLFNLVDGFFFFGRIGIDETTSFSTSLLDLIEGGDDFRFLDELFSTGIQGNVAVEILFCVFDEIGSLIFVTLLDFADLCDFLC